MDSEVADHRDIGVHEDFPLASSTDLPASNPSGSINSPHPSPAHSLNGHFHHHLPSPEPLAPSLPDLSAELESSKDDNQALLDEITCLRGAHAAMEDKQELLQRELLGDSEKVEAFSADIASLEEEKKNQEDLAACTVQEIHGLHTEIMDLQAETGTSTSQIKFIDAMLAEISEKSSLLAKDVDEKQAAMAVAQTEVHLICFEIEKLQLEKEEFFNEVSLMEASNSTLEREINQLRERVNALSNKLDQSVVAKVLAEKNVSNVQAHIAALKAQVSTNKVSDEQMQVKLSEAKERLKHLEEEDKAMALRERTMEACIVNLQGKLHALKADFDNMERAEEQENKAAPRSLEVTHTKTTASLRELQVLKAASDAKQQHVQELQSHVSAVREEKEALTLINEELEAELRTKQGEVEAEESLPLREDALNGFVERSTEPVLRRKLQELIAVNKRKPMLASLGTPLLIAGGTVAALGLLVYVFHSKSKSK